MDIYKLIVEALLTGNLEKEIEHFPSPNSALEYEWSCMLADIVSQSQYKKFDQNSFQYDLRDINEDGKQELLWLIEGDTIIAVFSVEDSSANLLDAYWSRHKCIILESGELYTYSSGGVQDFEYAVQKIDGKNSRLSYVLRFGCEEGNYYQVVENEKISIIETEFEKLLTEYPDILE